MITDVIMSRNAGRYASNKGQWKGGGSGGAGGGGGSGGAGGGGGFMNLEEDRTDLRIKEAKDNDIIDSKYGFDRSVIIQRASKV